MSFFCCKDEARTKKKQLSANICIITQNLFWKILGCDYSTQFSALRFRKYSFVRFAENILFRGCKQANALF